MIPAVGWTMKTGAEMETVPRGTSALLPTPPEGAARLNGRRQRPGLGQDVGPQLVSREPVRRPGGHRRGPPPGQTGGPDHAAAGEGHHETAGQVIRETQEASQGADQRGSGRGYVHVYGVHSGGVYPRAEQHEHGPGSGREKLAVPSASAEDSRILTGVAS